MQSLVLAKYSPFPPLGVVHGSLLRQRLFLAAIRLVSSKVDLAWFDKPDAISGLGPLGPHEDRLSNEWGMPVRLSPIPERDARPKTAWTVYGAGAVSAWGQEDAYYATGPAQVAKVAERLARCPDLVFVSRLSAMGAFMQTRTIPPRLFFDLDDVEHRKLIRTMKEMPRSLGKYAYMTHAAQLILAERWAVRTADATFVCSEEDRQYLGQLGMRRGVAVVPNALPVPVEPAPSCPDPTILFIGGHGYQPNAVAAERLATRIFPLIQHQVPAARLIVAGSSPERIPSFRSPPPAVEFTGFVPDLDKLYARSRVVTCPITTGGGTRIKLVEAASYGRPMVSTRLGAEGLAFEDGREIMLRDDDIGFAAACVSLLRDDAACARLGEAARAKMQALYADKAIVHQIAGIMEDDDLRSGAA